MADDSPDFTTQTIPTLQQLADYFIESIYDPEKLKRLTDGVAAAQARSEADGRAANSRALSEIHKDVHGLQDKAEAQVSEWIGFALAKLVGDVIGVDVPAESLGTRQSLGESGVGHAVGDALFDAIRGTATTLEPGPAGAKRLMAISAHISLHGWFIGILTEKLEKFFSYSGMPIENIARLGEELVEAMGVGRLARVALRPLAQITMATPLEWDLHKQFRPTMLAPSTVARQWQRGRWDWADVVEELARAGYSDARIDAIINEQRKFLGVGDVRLLEDHGAPAEGDSLKYLGEAGYDQADAELFLRVEGARLIEALNSTLAGDIGAAFADRKITAAQRDEFYSALGLKATKLTLAQELADTRRALNTKFLSAAQVADCVKVGILGFTDYRDALTREGYSDADGAALELLLRHSMDVKADLEKLKEHQAADRAAAQQARADAAAKKEADAAARALLAKRGSIADNKAAAVRGLIPMARYQELLAAHYDADTVTAMVGLAEQARQDYLDAQQRRDDAAKRALDKGLNLGQLEAAVLTGVLTVTQFRDGATRHGLAPADVDILAATLEQRLADRAAAEKKRADAAQKAAAKHPTLATIEALVRAGHRSMADYDAFLAALGYDDAGRAAIEELLQTKIAADAAAAAARAAVTKTDPQKGLTLDQFRRGVLLGVKSIADYTSFLVSQKFTTDAISVLVAELRDAVDTAAAVRARRDAVKPAPGSPRLPLASYTKAARLGLITIDAYRAHLAALGYADDEIELDVDELLVEIADTQAKRAAGGGDATTIAADVSAALAQAQILRAALDAGLKAKQLSSAELEQAVHAGKLSIEDYISEAESVGLGAADAELLAARLASQIAATTNAPAPASGKVSRAKKKAPANVP